jgi:hypothetical protein
LKIKGYPDKYTGKGSPVNYYICESAYLMDMSNNIPNLYFRSKRISLMILAATAIICSRGLFLFFNDPEGPNLLIVAGLALPVYLLSSTAYIFSPFNVSGIKRLSATICIQILLVISLYLCMK